MLKTNWKGNQLAPATVARLEREKKLTRSEQEVIRTLAPKVKHQATQLVRNGVGGRPFKKVEFDFKNETIGGVEVVRLVAICPQGTDDCFVICPGDLDTEWRGDNFLLVLRHLNLV